MMPTGEDLGMRLAGGDLGTRLAGGTGKTSGGRLICVCIQRMVLGQSVSIGIQFMSVVLTMIATCSL